MDQKWFIVLDEQGDFVQADMTWGITPKLFGSWEEAWLRALDLWPCGTEFPSIMEVSLKKT